MVLASLHQVKTEPAMSRAHNDVVEKQFGPQAQAYVASATHASGPGLDRIEDIARNRRPAKALDLGCGGGHASYRLAPFAGEVIACDLSADMLAAVTAEAARRNITNLSTEKAAAEALPFAAGAFDMLVCRMSAHHWQDLDAGLREAHRVLRTGAPAVFIDVVSPAHPMLDTHLQAVELLRDPSHVRDYRIAEWLAALARAGFNLRRAGTHELPLEFMAWVERMQTPQPHVTAIRSLQLGASQPIREAFAIRDDGSFTLQIATFELEAQ